MTQRESAFSSLHPFVCFAFFTAAIGFGVTIQHPFYVAAGIVSAASFYLLLHRRAGLKFLTALLPLIIVVCLINPLFNPEGVHILFFFFGRPYTAEALVYGAVIAGIFLNMALWFACFHAIMTGDKLLCLFGSRLPSLSLLMVMVLRLIPELARRATEIRHARTAIGQGGGDTLRQKVRAGITVLTALSANALENSIITADSMRARGYGSRRSSFQLYRFTRRDALMLLLMLFLLIWMLLGAFSGAMRAAFTPVVSVAPICGSACASFAAYALFLLLPTLLSTKEVLVWRVLKSKI